MQEPGLVYESFLIQIGLPILLQFCIHCLGLSLLSPSGYPLHIAVHQKKPAVVKATTAAVTGTVFQSKTRIPDLCIQIIPQKVLHMPNFIYFSAWLPEFPSYGPAK